MAVIGIEWPSRFETRYTIKLLYTASKDPKQDIILVIKAFYKQIKKVVDKKFSILSWFDLKDSKNELIVSLSQFLSTLSDLGALYP